MYNTSNIPSDKELVQIRKTNQKLFDNLVLGSRQEKVVQNVEIPKPRKKAAAPKKTVNPKISEAKVDSTIKALRGDI
ncbi:MAG: hypothetical protein AAF673_01520 [Pseudomonadota bacterium]